MQLPLNKEEEDMFNLLAGSNTGYTLAGFVDRMIKNIESVRTQTSLSLDARIEVANYLQENFLDRMHVIESNKNIQLPLNNEME